jgi:hypothetical protein
MNNDHAPSAARVGAAIAILDRGWGKPTQAVEASVSILDQMTDDEQKAMLAALEALRERLAVRTRLDARLDRRPDGRSGARSDAGLRPECANSGHSLTALGTMRGVVAEVI